MQDKEGQAAAEAKVQRVLQKLHNNLVIEIQVAVTMRNGKHGGVIDSYAIGGEAATDLGKLKLGIKDIAQELLAAPRQLLGASFNAFAQNIGPVLDARLLKFVQEDMKAGLVAVIEMNGKGQEKKLIVAK